jgi:hypothetical protein
MKKLIIAAVLLMMTTVQSFAGPIVTLSVEFGHKNANQDCIERGICHVTVGWSKNITATVNDNTGNLEFTFLKTSMSKEVFDTQFINGIFEVPISYDLPNDVCQKLGVDKFTIKTGKYKIVETKTQYTIVFNK